MGEPQPILIVIPLFIVAIGLCLSLLGIAWLRRERAFTRDAIRAEGVVSGFERRRQASSRISRRLSYRDHPVVRYTTREGQPAQFASPVGTMPRLHREGQHVPIVYNPANPTEGRIATGAMQYAPPIALIVFGLAAALFAGLFAASAWGFTAQLPAG